MKYKSNIDNLYCILISYFFATSFALCVCVILLRMSMFYTLLAALGVVLVILICYFICERYYIFNKNEYVIKVGFISKRFKYKDIKKCFITRNYKLSYATSQERICIITNDKTFYISPENINEVLLILINRRAS